MTTLPSSSLANDQKRNQKIRDAVANGPQQILVLIVRANFIVFSVLSPPAFVDKLSLSDNIARTNIDDFSAIIPRGCSAKGTK